MSPWSNYTFRVIARNKVGDSLPSGHSKVCLTPEDVPYKNPDNVEGRGTAPNNLVIYWTVCQIAFRQKLIDYGEICQIQPTCLMTKTLEMFFPFALIVGEGEDIGFRKL